MNQATVPLILGALAGLVLVGLAAWVAARRVGRAQEQAARLLAEARAEAEAREGAILVAAQEKVLALSGEADQREHEIEEREAQADTRARALEQVGADQARERKQLERRAGDLQNRERTIARTEEEVRGLREEAKGALERVAGLTREQARAEVLASIEEEAQREASRISRRLEEENRQNAEREARNLILQASQRVNLRDVMESTVTFIELPDDEMKGRIIGKEGRNIRAFEMATGVDLIVDDTPRSIWISSFDPLRREVARVAIDRLLEDGRIHPARIEEAVASVHQELDGLIEQKGHEAAFSLGISDLNPKLARLVGKMRYHISHGQNLLQHATETALIAGFMCQELGGRVETAQRAGLLHEIGQVVADSTVHPIFASADICAKLREPEEVLHAIRSLHPDVQATTLEALLLGTANRLSENRPGARKDNLAVFIERLRRLETIALSFPGVERAYAIKSGKEVRVIVDVKQAKDETAYRLSREIARAVERELSYPGQIKVSVVRETRAVRYAV
jgi:ribonucrease Y